MQQQKRRRILFINWMLRQWERCVLVHITIHWSYVYSTELKSDPIDNSTINNLFFFCVAVESGIGIGERVSTVKNNQWYETEIFFFSSLLISKILLLLLLLRFYLWGSFLHKCTFCLIIFLYSGFFFNTNVFHWIKPSHGIVGTKEIK